MRHKPSDPRQNHFRYNDQTAMSGTVIQGQELEICPTRKLKF